MGVIASMWHAGPAFYLNSQKTCLFNAIISLSVGVPMLANAVGEGKAPQTLQAALALSLTAPVKTIPLLS